MISKYKRLAKALVKHRGEWVRNRQLADEAGISTRTLGRLMISVLHNDLAERRSYQIYGFNRELNVEYCCVTGDVEVLGDCMQSKYSCVTVGRDGAVHVDEHSESWFTQACRVMGE